MKNISQVDWESAIENDSNAIILDVRTLGECSEGIIENAVMIDFLNSATFQEEIEKLDQTKNYYVYCRSGNRSGQACRALDNLAIKNTFNLVGGMLDWNGKTVIPA
ncbi:rhodanese-like domain-containing protein [Dokdonia sp. Asnod1-B02]|uniref:rhodanese-like domain-containing protein n=1 Tax=Dokdonia sp. Asnod1-B02 TaxID=3160573 RepID=UPI003868ED80